jgi:DNA repair protein RadC
MKRNDTAETERTLSEILTKTNGPPLEPIGLINEKKECGFVANFDEIKVAIPRMKMIKENEIRVNVPKTAVTASQKAVAIFRPWFEGLDHERAAIITLDAKSNFINLWWVGMGGQDHVDIDVSLLFSRVLAADNARSFIVCHNHLDEDTDPSKEDLDVFDHINQGAKYLNRPMRDFMIVGSGDSYYSHREQTYDI